MSSNKPIKIGAMKGRTRARSITTQMERIEKTNARREKYDAKIRMVQDMVPKKIAIATEKIQASADKKIRHLQLMKDRATVPRAMINYESIRAESKKAKEERKMKRELGKISKLKLTRKLNSFEAGILRTYGIRARKGMYVKPEWEQYLKNKSFKSIIE